MLTRIDHIGIACFDLDKTVEFYRTTYGFEVFHTEVNEEQGVHEAMVHAQGDKGDGTAIQLLAPLRPDSTIGKFIDKKGPGIQQLALRVSDIEAASAALRAKGLRLLYETAKRGTANSKVNFIHPKDAGGVLVELVEPAPEH